ncbi:MAG: RdgB/HAM1 family non-canonical purine NTP pyrophosphatase [Candidatus Pacebacteria bacterium]|nr:RdgB/HAM1 family non-canonical purine NTP pyrophosphatase [Candidatus Paceibacterota bacterium]
MKKLLIATHNAGKKKEISEVLGSIGWEVLTLDDISLSVPEPEETGTTYEENALIKAKHAGDISGLLTIADDSGIEVEALPGELGVYSSRFAKSDEERVQKLLKTMEGQTKRGAKFVSCIVIYDPVTQMHNSFFGEVVGKLAEEPRGSRGFGYDPIFIPNGYEKTFGELGNEVKNTISHRAKALGKMKKYLQNYN